MIDIIDYRAGNAPSVLHALHHLGLPGRLVSTPEQIAQAERLILPGVGAARVPVIASGGAGSIAHVASAFADGGAYAAIISSLLYSPRLARNLGVREIKAALPGMGTAIRPWVADT